MLRKDEQLAFSPCPTKMHNIDIKKKKTIVEDTQWSHAFFFFFMQCMKEYSSKKNVFTDTV